MKLTEITLDPELQSRETLNQDTIHDYSEKIREGVKFPALKVYRVGSRHYLVDGWHRYFAYKKAGIVDVEVIIVDGTKRDALLASTGVNKDHGLPPTRADRRRAVLKLLDDMEWSLWSNREIAVQTGVTHPTVMAIRESLGKPQPEAIKFERNGKEFEQKVKYKDEQPTVPAPAPEEDKLHELATEIQALAEENERLEARVAVAAMEGTATEKGAAQAIIEELQATVKNQEIAIRSLTISRDTFQNKCSELMKQVTYWKKQAQKMAA
jgi:ParB-like chromosome segregation protein Spo0J